MRVRNKVYAAALTLLVGGTVSNNAFAENFLERLINVPVEVVKGALEVPARVVVEAKEGNMLALFYAVPGAVNGATRIGYSLGYVFNGDMGRYDRNIGEDGPVVKLFE